VKRLWQYPYLKSRIKALDVCIDDQMPLPEVINILIDLVEETGRVGGSYINEEGREVAHQHKKRDSSGGVGRALLAPKDGSDGPSSLREAGEGLCS